MARNLINWLALGSLLAAGGCRACCHGYEYFGPAIQGHKPPLGFNDRRGSILGPGPPAAAGPVDGLPDPEPTLAPIPPTAPGQQSGLPGT